MQQVEHEQIIMTNRGSYRSIVALHDTSRGPAMGGTRFRSYDTFERGYQDALRLSKAMTRKAAFAGLPFGGGKAVIMKFDDADRETIFDRHAGVLNELQGRFVTAEDVGTTPGDMDRMSETTDHVLGTTGGAGDPGPVTAMGILCCIQVGLEAATDKTLGDAHVALQGLGSVGFPLGQQLHEAGAELTVTDTDEQSCERARNEWSAAVCEPDEIYQVDADVFAPCAIGGVLNERTVPQLQADLVAGSANNPLSNDGVVELLHEQGVLYLPDFAINTGGLISVTRDRLGLDSDGVRERVGELSDRVEQLIRDARHQGRPPYRVALNWVEKALSA